MEELADRLRDLMKVVRRLKQQREGMPTGILLTIDQLTGRDECCHAKELASHSGLDQSTVSRAVATLVGLGLLERVPDPADRRASILAVTAAGRDVLAETREPIENIVRAAYGDATGHIFLISAGIAVVSVIAALLLRPVTLRGSLDL
jgi:DNA-binding MarR family transcriptional regulator